MEFVDKIPWPKQHSPSFGHQKTSVHLPQAKASHDTTRYVAGIGKGFILRTAALKTALGTIIMVRSILSLFHSVAVNLFFYVGGMACPYYVIPSLFHFFGIH